MNGYTSSTASITLDSGHESVHCQAQVARQASFVDFAKCARQPRLPQRFAGFGDCLCRPVDRLTWWMSHRLLDTVYYHDPYSSNSDEIELMQRAKGIAEGDLEAVAISSVF